jgi:ATP synthase protein I
MGRSLDWRRVRRLLFFQSALVASATVAGAFFGKWVALSAFLGGGIALSASAVFAFWVFAPYRAQQPGVLVTRFYVAEVGKLLLVASAFAVIFIWLKPLNIVALFVSFFLVQVLSPVLAHWLAGEAQR